MSEFKFGDKVTYLNEKAIFIYGNSESVNVARPYSDTVSWIRSDKITAGWPPEVFEDKCAKVYHDDNIISPFVCVPDIFKGKKVKIEEILE